MHKRTISLAALLVTLLPAAAGAVDQLSVIDEIMAGYNGNASIQYVEIRMKASGQTQVSGSRIGFFKCDGSTFFSGSMDVISSDVANDGTDVRWLMASSTFAAAAGIQPDFVIDGAITSPDRYPCGMVCWGNPTTPSHADNYVDCVAYGGYHGTGVAAIPSFAGTASSLAPGDGTMSLTRIHDTQNNANDFALMAPSPTNNAGQVGLGGSTTTTTIPGGATTTTTVVGSGATTTTTLAPGGVATNLVPGGGPAKSDCYVELGVRGATDISGNKVVNCTDGDPCDSDGMADGTCTFEVALCPNQSLPGCTTHPPVALSGKSVGLLTPPTDLSGSDCGPFADVKVSLKGKRHNRPGKTVLHVKAKVTGGKPKTDVDNVKFVCRPRTGT